MEKSLEKKAEQKKSQIQKIIDVSTPSQMLCLALTLILFSKIPACISSANTYSRFRKLENPSYDRESLEDFWIVIPCSLVIRLIKVAVNKSSHSYFKGKLQHKYSGETLENKIVKCSRGVFKVLYFTFTFCFGLFAVLRQTPFASPTMFGDGEMMYTFGSWPYTVMPYGLKFYYLLSFSYYVEDGIMHLFMPPNYDYWEMILHHTLTAMLIFASYMNGFWNIGIFVLIQMDMEDIWIGMIRVVMDYSSTAVVAILYS